MAAPKGESKSASHKQGPETDNSEFRWGVKRGAGAKGKEIQFYDSFTYEGVEYSRYDCVYIHKDGEQDPYIGKIIKIWDDRKDKKKKMKVLWFFRPIEIRNWVDIESSTANKEIFLARGEGKGVFNINVLGHGTNSQPHPMLRGSAPLSPLHPNSASDGSAQGVTSGLHSQIAPV